MSDNPRLLELIAASRKRALSLDEKSELEGILHALPKVRRPRTFRQQIRRAYDPPLHEYEDDGHWWFDAVQGTDYGSDS